MLVPDVNLLVYAYNSDAPLHARARRWWEDSLSGSDDVGLPWAVILGYVRLMTSRAVLPRPLSAREALAHARAWLGRPQALLLLPGARHLDVLDSLASKTSFSGTLATDAHLAALAIEHQAELHSNDSDFARFPGLRWRNPLA